MQHHVCSAFNEVTCTRARKRSGLKGRGENARAIRSFCLVRLLAGRTSRACVEPQMCGMERVPRALYRKAEQRRSNQAVSHWLLLHFCTLALLTTADASKIQILAIIENDRSHSGSPPCNTNPHPSREPASRDVSAGRAKDSRGATSR